MINVTVEIHHNDNNGAKVTAKGKGKQRTLPYDHAISHEANLGSAVGTLANVLLSPMEQAKILHPSGGQRVQVQHIGYNKFRYRMDV